MSFFDDFSKNASSVLGKAAKGVESATKTAVRKSSNFAEVSKLKMKISAEEKAVSDLYYAIGKKVYADCAADGVVPESVQDECSTIYEHKARIADLQGKIELVRGDNQFETTEEEAMDFSHAEETLVKEEEIAFEESASEFSTEEEPHYSDISDSIKKQNKE